MITVNQLITGLATPLKDDISVTSISMDSRDVQDGGLFIATAKIAQIRQKHIDQAITGGACAVLTDSQVAMQTSVPVIQVDDLDQQISVIGSRYYGNPSENLTIIAVTGTNGKTSVTNFIAQCLEHLGNACGIIGTLGQGRLDNLHTTNMTTPNPLQMQKILAKFVDDGIKYVALEASSHALVQGRLNAVTVDIAVMTNLSRDHLDYHGDMQAYGDAKARLFALPDLKTAIINKDDAFARQLPQKNLARLNWITVSQLESADFQANNIQLSPTGLSFQLVSEHQSAQVQAALLGRFNIDNLLLTAGVLSALAFSEQQIIQALSASRAVPGRMQLLQKHSNPAVVLDYAHTPDALTQALQSMRQHLHSVAELWCVFGCGGDRDRGKRPLMAAQAESLANHLIITDDNPRSEASEAIHTDIVNGLSRPDKAIIEADRRQAIYYAVATAGDEDMVLVAGKGHEDYQEKQGVKMPFSDAEVISEALQIRQQTRSGASL